MNKPRLIDANELIKAMEKKYAELQRPFVDAGEGLCGELCGITKGFTEVDMLINAQPTAYDIDKVVEQLKEESFTASDCEFYGKLVSLEDAIEIVKGGGKHDD